MGLKITKRSGGDVRVKPKNLAGIVQELATKAKAGKLRVSEAREALERAERDEEETFFSKTDGRVLDRGTSPRISFEDPSEAYRSSKGGAYSAATRQKAYELAITGPIGATPNLFTGDDAAAQARLHELQDGFALCKAFVPTFDARRSKRWREYEYLAGALSTKIMTTQSAGSGSGTGGDFIPDMLSGTMVDLYRQQLMVGDLFEHLTMPYNPFTLPLEGVDTNAYYVGEASDDSIGSHSSDAAPARTPATSAVTLSAKKFKVRGVVSEEAEEDAIFSMIGYLRAKLTQASAESFDDVLINGDDSSTHQDSDVTTSTDHRKAFDGLRILTTSGVTHDVNGALAAADFLNIFAKMGKFAQVPGDTALILSPVGITHLLAEAKIETLEKFGANATILKGQVGQLYGRPVIVSGKVRENLNSSGVYDGSTTTKGMAIVVHRPSFLIGDRRTLTVESAKDITTGKTMIVTTMRTDFKRTQAESSSPVARNVGYLYNINTAASF